MTTEIVTTSDDVHRCTDKFKTSYEVVKGTDKVQKCNENIRIKEDVQKGTEKLEDMKKAVVKIRRKDSDKFEGQSNGSSGWFNIDSELKKRYVSTIEADFYNNLYEKYIEGPDMEPYETFLVPFDYNKSELNNINDPVKNRASSSEKEKKANERFVAPICGKITLPK